uniref:Uncharacterized protein n=1 Tax=Oryza glumipatula TaxID=40148 RepID=A0A0E0ARC6_9ORYZ
MEMDGVYIRRDTDLPQIYLSTIVLLAAQLSSLCEEEVGIGRMQQRLCVWKETVKKMRLPNQVQSWLLQRLLAGVLEVKKMKLPSHASAPSIRRSGGEEDEVAQPGAKLVASVTSGRRSGGEEDEVA